MSGARLHSLLELAQARRIIPADARWPAEPDTTDRPWFISLLQGVAGWLAGIFLLAFIGVLFHPEATSTLLVLGSLLMASAWLIYHADRQAMFLDQLALALSIAGQLAVAWAIFQGLPSGASVALALFVLQLLVLVVMPNVTARILATLFATLAWVFLVRLLLHPRAGEFAWLTGAGDQATLTHLFGSWALCWVPMAALTIALIRLEPRWMAGGWSWIARPALTGLLLGLALGGVIAEPLRWLALGTQSLGQEFGWTALFPLLSMALALLTVYGGFRLRSGGLTGFGIAVALLHLARFYYVYGTTLLWKSAIMFGVGVVMLGLGYWLRHRGPGRPA